MIPSLVPDIEGIDWTYDDVAREMDDIAMLELEPDAGARSEMEDEGARPDELGAADDDIGRAVEEMEQDEDG